MRRKSTRALTYMFLIAILIFNIIPFYWMMVTSFKTDAEAYAIPPTWWPVNPTLYEGYGKVLMWTNFPRHFLNSVIVSLGAALLSTLVGAFAGYGFSRFQFRGRTSLMAVLLASQMLPGVLLVGPYFKMLARLGLYNTYPGLILAFCTLTLPFSAWMLKGFIDTVPQELDEAALIDGCSRVHAFLRVVFPLITPGMVATLIFAFLLAWGDLLWVLCLTSTDSMATVTLGLSRLVTQFRVIWPQLMAGSVIAAFPPMLLYLLLQNYLVKGLTGGAVKE
ncbi:MAG: ABC-type sugar transport system, permease component [Acetothermia bacterium 64_32]|nr:MAG: ABC-type sugar transport system, permease component [Acetothermia bacterium 64_32]